VSRACTFTIDAAKAGAGNMEIIVSVGKRNVPNYVQAEGQARFRVSVNAESFLKILNNKLSMPYSVHTSRTTRASNKRQIQRSIRARSSFYFFLKPKNLNSPFSRQSNAVSRFAGSSAFSPTES
jgi:hypothetical protein